MARLAVVLGSGGARGYAHIGALEVAEERGHEVVAIAGTSMGALVGGLAAAGKLGQFTVWATGLKQFDVLRMMDPALGGPGITNAKRVTKRLQELLQDVHIEDLGIPYTAVATDLGSRREVWFQHGPLDVAIRASIAMPSFITPVLVGDRLMVDGGLVNPLPIEPTLAVPADGVLAIDLNGPTRSDRFREEPTTPLHAGVEEPDESPDWLERFRRGASEWLDQSGLSTLGKRVEPDSAPDLYSLAPAPKDLKFLELISQSVDLMGSLITRYRSASNPPDILIRVPHDACRITDFHRAADMIVLGRRLATEAFDAAGW